MAACGKLLVSIAIVCSTPSAVLAMKMKPSAATHSKKPGCGPMAMVSAKKKIHMKAKVPGAGMDPSTLAPFENSYMDGFYMMGCVKDDMLLTGDKFGDGKFSYKLGSESNVSIVLYSEMVPKEDAEPMTHEVCFGFCRTIPDMLFFGLAHGRDCYCTPYIKQIAGDSSDCDAVCAGDPTTMCGGKTKSSVFEMHSCDDAVANLEAASSAAQAQRMKLVSIMAEVDSAGNSMQEAAETLQKSFGKVGDSAATTLFQAAKKFAGELVHSAADGLELATKIEGLEGEAASSSGTDASKESVTASLQTETAAAKASIESLTALEAKATEPEAGVNSSAELYYPAMYFVDKEFDDVPSTCGGTLAADPLIASYGGCAAACEAAVETCVGFSYFGKGSLCFLLSELESVTYYTGCGSAAFLQSRAQASKSEDTKCAVKFNKFEGKSIKPDASGKCDGCLKEASKADRCFE